MRESSMTPEKLNLGSSVSTVLVKTERATLEELKNKYTLYSQHLGGRKGYLCKFKGNTAGSRPANVTQ